MEWEKQAESESEAVPERVSQVALFYREGLNCAITNKESIALKGKSRR